MTRTGRTAPAVRNPRPKAQAGRSLVICLALSIPVIEACSTFFDPSHGSIAGTWVRRFPGEEPATWWPFPPTWTLEVTEDPDGRVSGTITKQEYWNIDPPPPDLPPLPPQIWTVEGARRGSKVRLTFEDNRAVRQYFEGKHVSPNLMEGFISRQEGSELRATVEFVRRLIDPSGG